MLDINLIRKDPEFVKAALAKREYAVDFGEMLEWDGRRRELMAQNEAMKAERNKLNKDIPRIKKEGGNIEETMAKLKDMAEQVKAMDEEQRALEEKIQKFVEALPNLPAEDVVAGGKENNQVVKTFGQKPEFPGGFKNHVELCTELGLIDYERGVKMGGNGFWLYTDLGARLEWALLNYFITQHIKDGYTFMLPPHILTYECGYTAGQFPKFEDDVYRVGMEGFHFLLPTAETALINLYRGEILDEADLPKKLFAYTPCYRQEAGTYRASERGMIRGHQFNKVEMFGYTKPEDSDKMLKELINKACALVEGLGLHYQLSKLAAGDCSASMATTYDIELWIPSMNEYKECSSVSNARDYQARRGNIRFRRAETKKTEFVHTLNGSGLATSRLIPAIVEQYQQPDGSVIVPEVLRPFLGMDKIEKKR
ncbi:MAG TPA: serine--tRNA ligase [Candidatus Faecaligallichristensenella faecipullorum]|nr:serine--tRNA ligase [Candidatus Faecaligallichristensenella faecipullorum]